MKTSERVVTFIIITSCLIAGCSGPSIIGRPPSAEPFVIGSFPLTETWNTQTDGSIISTPQVREGLIAVWTTKGIQLLDGQTGEKKWQHNLTTRSSPLSPLPPFIVDGYVLAPYDEFVDVLSLETGEITLTLRAPQGTSHGVKSIAVDDDRAYVVWGSNNLTAYTLATGEVVWQADDLGTRAPPHAIMCGVHRLCLVLHNFVELYDTLSGDTLGKIEVGEVNEPLLYPVYDGKITLFVVKSSIHGMKLVSLNLETNSENWRASIPDVYYPPALSSTTLYVPGAKPVKIVALDTTTNQVLWENVIDDETLQTPVEFYGVVYARSQSGRIYAIDATQGQRLGSLQTSTYGIFNTVNSDYPFPVRPVAVNKVLAIPSSDGVYGYTTSP